MCLQTEQIQQFSILDTFHTFPNKLLRIILVPVKRKQWWFGPKAASMKDFEEQRWTEKLHFVKCVKKNVFKKKESLEAILRFFLLQLRRSWNYSWNLEEF